MRHRIGIAPLAIAALDADFTSTQIADNLLGSLFGFPLGPMDAAGLHCAGCLHSPALRMFRNVSIVLGHRHLHLFLTQVQKVRYPEHVTGGRFGSQEELFGIPNNPENDNSGVTMTTAIGDKIQKLRKEKGLTLEKLAKMTGSSKSYIWELENKSPPRPSAEKLSKIATQLGVTMDYLIDQEEKVSEPDAMDEMFFRKYKKLDQETKEKFRKIIDAWNDE